MALITSGCGKIKQSNALQATEQKKTMAAAVEAQTAAAQVGVRPGKELQLRICEGCEEFPRVIDLRSVPSRHCERFTRQFGLGGRTQVCFDYSTLTRFMLLVSITTRAHDVLRVGGGSRRISGV